MSQSPVQIVRAKASPEAKASPGGKADAEKQQPETPFNAVLLATKALLNGSEAKSAKQQSDKEAGEESAPGEGKKAGKGKGKAGELPEGAKEKEEGAPTADGTTQQSPVVLVMQGETTADAAQAGKTSLEGAAVELDRSGRKSPPGKNDEPLVAASEQAAKGDEKQVHNRPRGSSAEITLSAREGKGRILQHQVAEGGVTSGQQNEVTPASGERVQKGQSVPKAASAKSRGTGLSPKPAQADQHLEPAPTGPKGEASPLEGKADGKSNKLSVAASEQAAKGNKKQVHRPRGNVEIADQAHQSRLQKGQEAAPAQRAEGNESRGTAQKAAPGQQASAALTQNGPSQQAKQQAGSPSQGVSKVEGAAPPRPPSTSSDGGSSTDSDTGQEGSLFSSKSGQAHSAQSQIGADKSEGGAFNQRLRQHWMQTLQSKTLQSSDLKGGWKQLKLQLPGEDGTMQLMAKQGDQQMAVSVGFSDPALRSLMQGQVEQMRQTLQAEYDAPVDFSLMSGDEGQKEPGQERAAASRSTGRSAPNSEGDAADAGGTERPPLQRRTLSNHEWIG